MICGDGYNKQRIEGALLLWWSGLAGGLRRALIGWRSWSDVLPTGRVLFGKVYCSPHPDTNQTTTNTLDGQTQLHLFVSDFSCIFFRFIPPTANMSFVTRRALSTLIPPKVSAISTKPSCRDGNSFRNRKPLTIGLNYRLPLLRYDNNRTLRFSDAAAMPIDAAGTNSPNDRPTRPLATQATACDDENTWWNAETLTT